MKAPSRATWDADAAEDIKAPSVGAAIRWARRAALAKAEVGVADRTLAHWHGRARDAQVASMACPIESLREHIEKQAPLSEIMLAEEALADAIEAEDFASRVCRMLERPRNNGQASEKPKFGVQQGGRR